MACSIKSFVLIAAINNMSNGFKMLVGIRVHYTVWIIIHTHTHTHTHAHTHTHTHTHTRAHTHPHTHTHTQTQNHTHTHTHTHLWNDTLLARLLFAHHGVGLSST